MLWEFRRRADRDNINCLELSAWIQKWKTKFYKADDSRKVVIYSTLLSCTRQFISSDTMNAYVAFEGYCTQSGFIHKELCVFYDTDKYDHYLFKKPEEKLQYLIYQYSLKITDFGLM